MTSFTSDIILPIVSLLPFLSKNFDEKFAILKRPSHSKGIHYNTIKQALEDGAVVLAYGYVLLLPNRRAQSVVVEE